MEASKLQALHDTLRKLMPRGKMGGLGFDSFTKQAYSHRDNTLPKNALYANFVRPGHGKIRRFDDTEAPAATATTAETDASTAKGKNKSKKKRRDDSHTNEALSTGSDLTSREAPADETTNSVGEAPKKKAKKKKKNKESAVVNGEDDGIKESSKNASCLSVTHDGTSKQVKPSHNDREDFRPSKKVKDSTASPTTKKGKGRKQHQLDEEGTQTAAAAPESQKPNVKATKKKKKVQSDQLKSNAINGTILITAEKSPAAKVTKKKLKQEQAAPSAFEKHSNTDSTVLSCSGTTTAGPSEKSSKKKRVKTNMSKSNDDVAFSKPNPGVANEKSVSANKALKRELAESADEPAKKRRKARQMHALDDAEP